MHTEIESNSTDYGISHADDIIKEKKQKAIENVNLKRQNYFAERRN